MSNPWNGKAVLEVFWWNCWNGNYPADWYTFLAKLAPRISALGFDGIWTPPPCKDTNATNNMGYTPYDYYDIGQKNQNGAVGTRFGTQDAFLRLIAVAHANGLEVYPDIVLDHCGGGSIDPSAPWQNDYTLFHPNGFAGQGIGRWSRNWLDFHDNPAHWDGHGDWVASNGGPDFCYQGVCSDSGQADPNCASRRNARAWFTWFVRQTGVDGFRFDDVKGYPPDVVGDLLYNAMGSSSEYFCVGELASGNTGDHDTWAHGTSDRAGTFDYPFRFALADMVASNGYYDVGHLPSVQQQDRFKTVPFINNHDNEDSQVGTYIDPDNPRAALAYAIAMTVDGSPQFYYGDLFRNVLPWRNSTTADAIPSRSWAENLVWCHQKLAFKSGDYFVRYQDSRQLLILERGARAIVAINNDGSSWHDAWVSTAFPPNTVLHDYSGSRSDEITINADGWGNIAVPPLSYSVWGPTGVTGGFSPAPRRTVQQFEMDDDLGDNDAASPQYGGKAISGTWRKAGSIWPAAGSQVNIFVYSDTPEQIDLMVVPPHGSPALPQQSGQSTPSVPFMVSITVKQEGGHLIQARLSTAGAAPARIYVKVDYIGPANSDLF
jgi:alpha-amylase